MKFGTEKRDVHDAAFEEQVAHQHVPGLAYDIQDPTMRLMNIVGGGFFNEPKYYDSNRSYADFARELRENGKISSTILDSMGLTEQANQVIKAAVDVANSERPEDLLVIAAWARDTKKGLKLRSTPQILLAIAAAHAATKPFVVKYTPKIVRRADEIRQVFGVFRHLFMGKTSHKNGPRAHTGSFPHCLRKGLGIVLAATPEVYLLKYNGDDRPTFADVLKMVGGSRKLRRKAGGWPVSKPMFEYLVNAKYVEPLTPTLEARRTLFSGKAKLTPELLEQAGATWESVIATFGSTKENWEFCIPLMQEMALTRNLRNFEQAGISEQSWTLVYERLLGVEDTVQLPFRFFTASREVSSTTAKTAMGMMLDKSVGNVPELPGVTAVFVDNSGSATGCTISRKSSLVVSDCGNMLAAVLAKRLGSRALVAVFGDCARWVGFSQADTCLRIKETIDEYAQTKQTDKDALGIVERRPRRGVGGGTETGLWFAIDDLTKRKVHVDRMLLLSDLCCYTQGDNNCGVSMGKYFGSSKASIQSMVDKYRAAVNPQCSVYSINLNGHEQSQVRPTDKRTHLMSGWSEKLVNLISDIEHGNEVVTTQDVKQDTKQSAQAPQPQPIPAIGVLRTMYA